jgi:microcystin degradation protein MlrC
VGAKTVVVADGDEAKARALAARLAAEVFARRDATQTAHDTVDEAIDAALAAPRGPVVLAEVADNAGGGAPSDSTFVLRRLVERGVRDAAIGYFWDPVAVRFCAEAGEGATLELRVGGKCGPVSGDPVDLVATVRRVVEDHRQTGLSGGTSAMGTAVWIEAGGIDEVVLAMNATLEGQTTAHYLADRIERFPVRVTQLAHGLPVGGELDYLDEGTLAQALRARRPVA